MSKLLLLFAMLIPGISFGQNAYSVNWYNVSAGGGSRTGGQYSLTSTIGQPDANNATIGGPYSMAGGFWVIGVTNTSGLPSLTIASLGASVVVSWPNTGSYTLQQNSSLAAGSWLPSGYTITTVNGTNSVTISSPIGNLFFRLSQ